MFNIGPQELLVILLVALVIVGPKRLPELSRTIGRGLREFRRAQDEVTKTIRLGIDESEPTAPPSSSARTGAAADRPTAEPTTPETSDGDVADVARTLGRGLAEIRRARREVQRTFRVDLSETLSTKPDRPRRMSERAAADAPVEPVTATEAPDATDGAAEPGEAPPAERPAGPEAAG